jgi:hypothetical protein
MPTGRQSLPDNVYAISGGNPECFRRKFRRSAFLRIHNELAEVVRDVPDSGDSEAQARVERRRTPIPLEERSSARPPRPAARE